MLMYGTAMVLLVQASYEISQELFKEFLPSIPRTDIILIAVGITGGLLCLSYWYNYLRAESEDSKTAD